MSLLGTVKNVSEDNEIIRISLKPNKENPKMETELSLIGFGNNKERQELISILQRLGK